MNRFDRLPRQLGLGAAALVLASISAFSIFSAVTVANGRARVERNVHLLVGLQQLAERLVVDGGASREGALAAFDTHPDPEVSAAAQVLRQRIEGSAPRAEVMAAVTGLVAALRKQNAAESTRLGNAIDRLYFTVGLLVALAGLSLALLLRVRRAARALELAAQRSIEAAQREHAEQLALLSALAASTAHEVNNPLTAVMLHLELMKKGALALDPTLKDSLSVCLDGTRRIRDIVAAMRGLGAVKSDGPVSVGPVVSATLRLLAHRIEPKATVRLKLDAPGPVRADYVSLGQVLSNLVVNALEALPARAASENEILIETQAVDERWVELSVTDNGPGFPPGDAARFTAPFFTTKATGSGLGLFVSKRLVEQRGGTLTIAGSARGARVVVRLEKAPEGAASGSGPC